MITRNLYIIISRVAPRWVGVRVDTGPLQLAQGFPCSVPMGKEMGVMVFPRTEISRDLGQAKRKV
jgi:hypothetical protein